MSNADITAADIEKAVQRIRDEATRWVPVPEHTAKSVIGEGLHTGLRKGTDAPEAPDLWKKINDSDEAWSDALNYLIWGLGVMDMAVCKKEAKEDSA